MLGIDIPTAMLVIGVAALCVTTVISSLALPTLTFTWRRRPGRNRSDSSMPVAVPRRVITGRPAELPTLQVARQVAYVTDSPPCADDVRRAESLIEYLLEHHPERLVDLLTRWIQGDVNVEDPEP